LAATLLEWRYAHLARLVATAAMIYGLRVPLFLKIPANEHQDPVEANSPGGLLRSLSDVFPKQRAVGGTGPVGSRTAALGGDRAGLVEIPGSIPRGL
jgi:hypothetical protein